ncbi:MAG: VanW family protein [Bacillota bacterium]
MLGFIRIAFLGLCALLVVLCVLLLTVQPAQSSMVAYVDDGTFFEGITVNGIDISGMSFDQAKAALLPQVEQQLNSAAITVVHGQMSWVFTGLDLKLSSTIDDTLLQAMSVGRDNTLVNNLSEQQRVKEEGQAFTVSFVPDDAALTKCLQSIADEIDTDPVEPYAQADTSVKEPTFQYYAGTDGYQLDAQALAQEIKTSIAGGNTNSSFDPVLIAVKPQHDVEWVKANAVQRSVFTTSFNSSTGKAPGRVRNIQKASEILNGASVNAGEEFSFNGYIGPRTEKGGWALAPGIINGSEYEMQAGGGICQVSTTLYNALLCSGPEVKITTRKKHSWPSSYVDYSLDATVSTDGPDLAFINESVSPIYLFAYADVSNYTMTVYIYGAPLPEGVTYKTRGVTEKVLEPKETITIEEPLWPTGYKETVIQSRKGYVATAYRDKLVNGEVMGSEKLYTDTYDAVQGQIKVGTGPATLPKPAS